MLFQPYGNDSRTFQAKNFHDLAVSNAEPQCNPRPSRFNFLYASATLFVLGIDLYFSMIVCLIEEL